MIPSPLSAWRKLRCAAALAVLLLLAAPGGTAAGQEPPEAAPPPEARERADAEIQRLIDELNRLLPPSADERSRILSEFPDLYALAMLKLEKADIALGQPAATEYTRMVARQNLSAAIRIWGALSKGERPVLQEHGQLERAYVAPNDMSPQPYILYVPESYDGTEPFGLFVFLHGWTPALNKANWAELMYSPAVETVAAEGRCIILLPYGRSNTDFQGVGEDDVLRAIREVKEHYRIDEDRVFLSDISMGGMGVWTIGAHYPHLFAALIPIASRADFYMWKGMGRGSLPGFKAKLADCEFGAELIPNYRNLPCVIVHGLLDWVMPIEQSDRMHALLAQQGFDVEYAKLPGASHYTWRKLLTCPAVMACLQEKRRRNQPRNVTFRTHTLKYSRAYWAEITSINDWGQPAELTCELDESGARLRVETANVGALRVRPPTPAEDTPELRITWNGKAVTPQGGDDGWLELGPEVAAVEGPVKTPRLCGPIREAFSGPFVLVYGGERGGECFLTTVRAGADWVRFAQGIPRILPADAITPEIIERYNLVLFGTPEDNELIARVAPELPIGLGEGEYRVGGRSYDATEYGLAMIYPNPLAANRYLVINSGTLWGAELSVNHKYDMLPDFIIFADEKSDDGTESNEFVCAGFFDQHWRLSEDSTWYAAAPEGQ